MMTSDPSSPVVFKAASLSTPSSWKPADRYARRARVLSSNTSIQRRLAPSSVNAPGRITSLSTEGLPIPAPGSTTAILASSTLRAGDRSPSRMTKPTGSLICHRRSDQVHLVRIFQVVHMFGTGPTVNERLEVGDAVPGKRSIRRLRQPLFVSSETSRQNPLPLMRLSAFWISCSSTSRFNRFGRCRQAFYCLIFRNRTAIVSEPRVYVWSK